MELASRLTPGPCLVYRQLQIGSEDSSFRNAVGHIAHLKHCVMRYTNQLLLQLLLLQSLLLLKVLVCSQFSQCVCLSMSSQLSLMVDIYNAHDVETYILPIAFHLADDRVAQIRCVTLRLVSFSSSCSYSRRNCMWGCHAGLEF